MVQSIKATGSKIEHKGRAFFGMQMVTFLKANLKMISQTEMVSTRVRTALSTREWGLTIFSTVKAQLRGLMAQPTLAIMPKERSTASALISGQKEIATAVSGLIIK